MSVANDYRRGVPRMKHRNLLLALLALTSGCTWAAPLSGLSAAEVNGPAAVAPLEQPQPPAKLIVDPPLAGPLSKGAVFIQYRTENMRIEPVFGPEALKVTPRIGHIHVIVDDNPWHWADASGEPVILVGLPAGQHKVTIILADPTHKPVDRKTIEFTVPPHAAVMH
nr:MAG TPA: protein of unknown function (DUF4399) [Caudoviricetes sp.]